MSRFTYYAASYWYRDNEPSSVAVALTAGAVDAAIDSAMMAEAEHCSDSAVCDCIPPEQSCDLCSSDLCWSGVHPYYASSLFTAKGLLEHRRELLRGEVVWLDRG